jgi:flavin reductase (DIM6/NTAB) family NADH-FMN oxidoreductase RutF
MKKGLPPAWRPPACKDRGMSDSSADKQLASALGRIPSGLFIVTVRHGDAETGMLASWVQQCSFQPPQVTLAVRQGRYVLDWLTDGAEFIVNILDDTQTDMISHFGRGFAKGEAAFDGLDIDRPNGGPPVLGEALAYLRCRVTGGLSAGDHEVLLAEVVGGQLLGEGHPMVHVRKSGLHY